MNPVAPCLRRVRHDGPTDTAPRAESRRQWKFQWKFQRAGPPVTAASRFFIPSPASPRAGLRVLKLGTIAFGGPAAHVAMIEQEVVVRRRRLFADTKTPDATAVASGDGGCRERRPDSNRRRPAPYRRAAHDLIARSTAVWPSRKRKCSSAKTRGPGLGQGRC